MVSSAARIQYESMAVLLTVAHVLEQDVGDVDCADLPLTVGCVVL